MQNQLKALPTPPKRGPWNKGKLRPKHVWRRSGRNSRSKAVLATLPCLIWQSTVSFVAVAIRVEDVAASGYTADRAAARQKRPDGLSDSN
jgi:hypothetical protein